MTESPPVPNVKYYRPTYAMRQKRIRRCTTTVALCGYALVMVYTLSGGKALDWLIAMLTG